MGLFKRTEKAYSLAEAMKKLQNEEFKNYIAVPTNPEDIFHTKYWLRLDERLLKQVPYVKTPFQEKRRKMMEEIGVNEECKRRTDNISKNYNSRQDRRFRYNDYQSSKDYQQKYGEYGRW